MRSFRSRPVGWRYESHRHMLAAKGIGSKSSHVVMYPIDVAFEMRKKGSYSGSMNAKRGEGYLNRLEKSMRQKGFIEPIPAEEHEIAEGRLQEGKHRLIVAKRIGLKEVPVEISPDRGSLRATWESRHPDEAYVSPLKRKFMSNKYFMPFVEKTTVPVIDYPEEYNSFREKSVVKMSPDEFLRLSRKTNSGKDEYGDISQEEYEKKITEENKLKHIREGLKEGKDIPIGYLEFAPKGNDPVEHEGRHRAMVAREMGLKEIPVVLLRQRKLIQPEKGMSGWGSWEYGGDEIVPNRQFPQHKVVEKKILPFKYQSKKQDYNINYHKSQSTKYDFKEVGVDAKGRRVRKYDEKHWQVADKEKYLRAAKLKHEMPKVMEQLTHDAFAGDDETKKNARAVLVIAKTGMRPGTRKDMKADQKSYGVTTLKKSHVQTSGS